MISPMTKYSFILLSGDQEKFLEDVRQLGVVDITRSVKPVDEKSSSMLEKISEIKRVLTVVENVDYSAEPDFSEIQSVADSIVLESGCDAKIKTVENALDELESLKSELRTAVKDKDSRLPWGTFDAKRFEELESAGYNVHFYSVPEKKFDQSWKDLYALQVVNTVDDNVFFVTVSPASEEYSFPVPEIQKPQGDWQDSENSIKRIEEEIVYSKANLLAVKSSVEELKSGYDKLRGDLDLYLAGSAGEKSSENMITAFVGFAPSTEDARLSAEFDRMDIYWFKEDAVEEDNPPIKLRNNKFISMFEVLTGMYGMPVYSEFDPTPILGPFFLLFFSMCMGDAGYGILLIIIGLLMKKYMPSMKSMAPLVTTLGVGTFFVGTILGTFFGISLAGASWVPDWLKSCMITGKVAGYDAQMVLAIGIGVVHICLAMIVKAVGYTKRFGLKHTISTWAWLVLILGGLATAGLALAGVIDETVTKWIVIVVGIISGLGIYVFNTPGRNPLINIGAGLWDTYNMVTGLLGDVLSYIRLYALGLAGGMLGGAFNDLAYMAFDGMPVVVNYIAFALIVLFGHSLNLAMSCLGAFVHPLRLTFVEYFKNSGYEGRGVAYNPLTNNK